MTEEKRSCSTSCPPHQWDSDCEPPRREGRLRASSWDDSDDNSIPDLDCKTSRIYSTDEKKPRGSVAEEINELKRQFFKNYERESEDAKETDRRQSPARVKRRTKSSGSLSPVLEKENQISLEQIEKFSSGSEISPMYLNDFFTELRSRRISLTDPMTATERGGDEMPVFDRECIEMYNELSDLETNDGYMCKTSRKLSRILEVEESKKDSEKSSEENLKTSDLLEKSSKTPRVPPLLPPETQNASEQTKSTEQKFRSFSFELFNNLTLQKPTRGSLSERSASMFCPELDDDVISLSAKMGKTHLASTNWQDGWRTTRPNSPMESNRDEEKIVDSMESFRLNLLEKSASENPTPRKTSGDRRTSRTTSGKSKRSWGMESPRFMLSIDGDSVRSSQAEDINEGNSPTFTKTKSEKNSTRRRSPKMESPELVNFTQKYLKDQESIESLTTGQSSERKKGKQKTPRTSEEKPPSPFESHRTSEKSHKSSKSQTKSQKSNTPAEDTPTHPTETPKTVNRFDPNPPLDIPEDQTTKSVELEKAKTNSERSSNSKHSSQTSSDSKTDTTHRTTSTRALKPTSRRSENSLEDQKQPENHRIHPLETVSNDTSNTSTSRSSIKELPSDFSSRSELSNRESDIPTAIDSPRTENDKQGSRKSSRRSGGSHVSSSRSVNSWISNENLKPSRENPTSERTTGSLTPENERPEETHSKMEDDSGRSSSKRLSIINELSFEDLETGDDTSEKEEGRAKYRTTARIRRRNTKQNSAKTPGSYKSATKSPKNTWKGSSRSVKEKPSDEVQKPDEEKWSELIETFQRSSNSSFNLENNFPGFQDQKEISWDSIRESVLERKRLTERDGKSEETSLPGRSVGSEQFVKNKSFELIHVEEDLNNPTSGNKGTFLKKIPRKEESEISQNVYYVSANPGGAFGIGEFGDVTCWNVAEFGTGDLEKPKAHGDGVPTHKTSQVLPLGSELKGNEVSPHRQLRRERCRESKPSLNNPAVVEEDLAGFIPTNVKISKSDNYIARKTSEGSDCQVSTISSFLNDYCSDGAKSGKTQPDEVKSTSKSTTRHISDSESDESEKDSEFCCERTSRLCRSLETFRGITQRDENDAFVTEFDKTVEKSKVKEETADLNRFLARRKKERNETKWKKWPKTKNPQDANSKMKKKGSGSAKVYLRTGKPRPSVPHLKLRNSNCFQSFYKRFVSVFCMTSHSSAATSK